MKRLTLRASFFPGADSTPVATSTPHGVTVCTASATLSGVEPAGEDHAHPFRQLADQRPVEEVPGSGRRPVDEDRVGGQRRRRGDQRRTGRVRLDEEAHCLGDLADDVGRLVAVQLGAFDPGAVDDLDHSLGMLVAEHADGHDLRRQAAGDVVDLLDGHLAR